MVVPTIPRESSTRSVSSLYQCNSASDTNSTNHAENNHEMDFFNPSRKRVRRRRSVTLNMTRNEVIPVLSLEDYTAQEHSSTYYSRWEYQQMRDAIKHTVQFVKYQKRPPADSLVDTTEEVCVRGLECLADEFVATHRKRVRQLSLTAVFAVQSMSRHCLLPACNADNTSNTNVSMFLQEDPSEGIARAYMVHTIRSQGIASRWGHFDALDAGVDMSSTASTTTSVGSEQSESSMMDI